MPVERILVVDDEVIIRKSLEEVLRPKRYSVTPAGDLKTAEKLVQRDVFDLIFLDIKLPDGEGTALLERLATTPAPQRPMVVVMSGYGSIETAVDCLRMGALDYLIKPFSLAQVEVLVKKADSLRQILQINRWLTRQISRSEGHAAVSALRDTIRSVAATEATVLITGPSGGAAEVAHEIFRSSARANMPYVRIDCAARGSTPLESEFFGHEKGAFKGGDERRDGLLELAGGGTVLIEEIGAIPADLQAKLLRFLQEREFERMGGNRTMRADVRVLATSGRDLEQAVAEGRFREDLFYRLNVFPVAVPAPAESAGAGSVPAAGADEEAFPPLDEVEKRHILRALERTSDNRTQAAELLGISIRTLRNKLNLYRGRDDS